MKKTVWGTVTYFLGIILLSAVLSPALYRLIEYFHPHAFPFHRIISRVAMIIAIVGIFPLTSFWNIKNPNDIGLNFSKMLKPMIYGWSTGIAMISILAILQISTGHASVDKTVHFWKIIGFAFTAIVVSFLEETLFRGPFFRSIAHGKKIAIIFIAIVNSALFASLHFIRDIFQSSQATITDVLQAWLTWFLSIPSLAIHSEQWIILFAMGLLLCATVYRSKHLGWAIGLHMGWVFSLKMFNSFLEIQKTSNPWLGSEIHTGTLSLTILLLALLIVIFIPSKHESLDPSLR